MNPIPPPQNPLQIAPNSGSIPPEFQPQLPGQGANPEEQRKIRFYKIYLYKLKI